MTDNLGLDYDEVVIMKETSVAHGGVMAIYTDELVLTNKRIICLSKGVFGGTKKIYYYPLEQIKVFRGIPQVQQGKLSNGTASLDVYLIDGEEQFNFQTKNKKTISIWIEEIRKLFGAESRYDSHGDVIDEDEDNYEDDDSLVGAFKEVGDEFKDVGREFAEAFGFKPKKKKKPENSNSRGGSTSKSLSTMANMGIRCPSCGEPISINSRFCPSCGAPIGIGNGTTIKSEQQEVVCPKCGKRLDPSLKFCTECGTEIKPVSDMQTNNKDKTTEAVKENLTIEQQIELLQKLKSLVDSGVISQEEFEKKKKEIF